MIRTLIPKPVRNKLYRLLLPKSPVLWANWGRFSEYLAKKIPPQKPPVVVLSMPRSGSSWVGEILGLSPNSLYLREPITQTFLRTRETGPSFFEIHEYKLPSTYEQSAAHVFLGLPLFNRWITKYPQQWGLLKRKHKHIVIKEVNPFILDWLVKNFQPRIVYLIRHPAAVASSFNQLGYNGKQLESRFSKETLERYKNCMQYTHSFWAEHGAMQAIILKEIINQAKEYDNFRLVQYEHLCQNPVSVFKDLYNFAELKWNHQVESRILDRSRPQVVNSHDFSTQRNSAYEMNKWKHTISMDDMTELKEAYLAFAPPYYTSDWL